MPCYVHKATEILSENYPMDDIDDGIEKELKELFINALSEKKLTLSQTRQLFYAILMQFERMMPVTNKTI